MPKACSLADANAPILTRCRCRAELWCWAVVMDLRACGGECHSIRMEVTTRAAMCALLASMVQKVIRRVGRPSGALHLHPSGVLTRHCCSHDTAVLLFAATSDRWSVAAVTSMLCRVSALEDVRCGAALQRAAGGPPGPPSWMAHTLPPRGPLCSNAVYPGPPPFL